MVNDLCSPALMYLGFSLIQIIIDISRQDINKAMIKFILMCVFTLILNVLCKRGLTPISWLIVFIPFISMTIITTLALYVFGFSNRDNISLFDTQTNSMGLDYASMMKTKNTNTASNLNTAQQIGRCELSYNGCIANCDKSYIKTQDYDGKTVPCRNTCEDIYNLC